MLICVARRNAGQSIKIDLTQREGINMLGENIKNLRKQKGYSQETLANQLNVVRQTISKWETGQSVPDADMLENIANIFEVSVGQLLGSTISENNGVSQNEEIVKQLVILNEQLASQRRSRKRTIKIALISIVALIVGTVFLYIVALIGFRYITEESLEARQKVEIYCSTDEDEYYYEVYFDEHYQVREAGGDAWISNHIMPEQYDDVNVLVAQMEDYFAEHQMEYNIIWE